MLRRTASGMYLDAASTSMAISPAGSKKSKFEKTKRGRVASSEKRKEATDVSQMGVTQMASLVVSHLFAPLWSIGMSTAELEARGCLTAVDWESDKVRRFVDDLDEDFTVPGDQLPACFKKIFPRLEKDPVLVTVFIVLNLARLEAMEMSPEDVKRYSSLLVSEVKRHTSKSERNHTMWNDECSGGHAQRSLTEMGGEAVERIGEKSKAVILDENLTAVRKHLLQILLLTSCFCKYNYRDDNMYHVSNQLCTQMFLVSPSEVLSALVCGEKGPVYVSKYLRFLMITTGPYLTESDHFLPGKVSRSAALNVPNAVQNAWLPIFTSLLHLAHSNNIKAGQNICGAFTVALRHQLNKIDLLEKKIEDLEAISRDREQTALIEKKAAQEAKAAEKGMGAKVIDVVKKIPGDLLQAPKLLVEGNSKKEDDKEKKTKISQSIQAHREKIIALKRPLPTLLGLIRILLTRIHCHGDDGPRAWGELIEAVRLLQIYPGRTGLLAVDIMRAAAAAVQCMDCLLRHRLSRCFVGGGEMASFKRERAYLLVNPQAARCRTLCKAHLGFMGRALKKAGEVDSRVTQQLDRNNWTDDVLAPSSLVLNVMVKIAKHEESKKLDEGYLGPDDMMSNLRQLPPSVIAQYYPEVYRLMRGPIGGVGHLMTFSEGSGKGLKVVPSLYEALLGVYRKMVDESGHKSHEEMMHLYTPSPADPMINLVPRFLSTRIDPDDPGAEWSSLLQSLVREESKYYKEEEDYWGELTPHLEPFEIKIILAGGSGTIHHFVNGLAKLSTTGKLQKIPIIRTYPLPLGTDNLLCGWLEKQDAVYQQLVSWPLQMASLDDNLTRLSDAEVEQRITSQGRMSSSPETLESGMLRTALDAYLVDADKPSKIYVYKLEGWKTKGGPGAVCDVTIAWCQQIEFGPSTEAPKGWVGSEMQGGGMARGQSFYPSMYLPPSPMTASFDHRADGGRDFSEFLSSPSSMANQSRVGGLSPHRSTRGNSLVSRSRTGSNILPPPRIDLTTHMTLTLEELYNSLRESPAFLDTRDTVDYSKTASGTAIITWLTDNYTGMGFNDAHRVCCLMVDYQLITLTGSMKGNTPLLSPAGSAKQEFKDTCMYKLGVLPRQQGIGHARRNTLLGDPILIEIQNIALSGGQDYPDLRSGKDMYIREVSIRNVGKEGDYGLYPDPTEPALQVYILGHKDRKKSMSAPWNRAGEGQHYTILGQLTFTSKEEGKPLHVLVDGGVYGPFEKITISPWLGVDRSRKSAVKRHLSFDVMGFAPPCGVGEQ
eukprot:TRINITY_DN1907_c0_g2_i1.p1 TRINITY_DN1907_c0_g2~~TRINITY_DN1907_c0_g2_i1.p1  ORF type:complete len:1275 (+),score=291.99 TRINITY_DN1907_c0_g2_i1:346-4170(+)